MATLAGNTKALCNSISGILGLFSALTHTLLARMRSRATSCSSNSAALSSQPSPNLEQAPPGRAGHKPPRQDCPWCPQGSTRQGQQEGTQAPWGSSVLGGEGGTCQGCTKRFAMKSVWKG